MSIRELIISAFNDKEKGLTKNPALLKQKNPQLYTIPNETITSVLGETYNRDGAVKRIQKYSSYRANFVGEILHADLMFINSPRNTKQQILIDDHRYVLIIVDTYSRYLWVALLKDKNSEKISQILHSIVNTIKMNYYAGDNDIKYKILTDSGKEFSSRLINTTNVTHIISKNPRGAALAESAILKIRTKIKYLNKNIRTLSINDFSSIVKNINVESRAINVMNGEEIPKIKSVPGDKDKELLQQGDYVRVVVEKGIFDKKSSLDNFSDAIFIVYDSQYDALNKIYRYIIGSLNGQWISKRKWYKEELKEIPFHFIQKENELKKEKLSEFTKEEVKLFHLDQSKDVEDENKNIII